MAASLIFCPICNFGVFLANSAIGRARRSNAPLYCGRDCAGIARRREALPDAERRAAKAEYDRDYRTRNRATRKAQKAEYFRLTYDPAMAREERKKTMPRHIEYCRQPKYKAYKVQYDRTYRAKQDFGDYWECAILISDLDAEIGARITRNEIYAQNGTLNKSLRRKRDYAKTVGR